VTSFLKGCLPKKARYNERNTDETAKIIQKKMVRFPLATKPFPDEVLFELLLDVAANVTLQLYAMLMPVVF